MQQNYKDAKAQEKRVRDTAQEALPLATQRGKLSWPLPKAKDVPFLHVTDSYKAKYWVLDHVLLGHPLLSKYSTKWCIWAINATQVLCKCVHFFTISFLFYIITYSDHFRANYLRNRSTAHS